jgi:hypothetical protein
VATRNIFRESAIEAYRRGTEKDVVPRLISRPIVVCSWVLLAVLISAAAVTWAVPVPASVTASGILRAPRAAPAGDEPAAVLFVLPDRSAQIRPGQPVHLQIGASSPRPATGVVTEVEKGTIAPDEARARFGADVVSQPSVVVTVRLDDTLPAVGYAGSRITGRVEVGSQRVVDLLLESGEAPGAGR